MFSKTASVLTSVLLAQSALAFPAQISPELIKKALENGASEDMVKRAVDNAGNGVPDPAVIGNLFDAQKQYVDNKGVHEWRAPGPGDSRGPCPGLNAMANHGYIPRSGVGNIQQFIDGTYEVFGMGKDLGGFLAVLGAAIDGDLNKWSIGGLNAEVPLGTGLTGSHNKYENDISPTRPDLYVAGNNYEVDNNNWLDLWSRQAGVSNEESNYNLKILQEVRSGRFDQSVATNPYFFNGPFTGLLVQPAAFTFIYRFMGNKSAEAPDGRLNKETLKAFFGMTENADGSFSGGTGFERIPDNWYKRAIGAEYTIPFFLLDVLQEASVYPKFLNVGGNTGTTNSFTGLDLRSLTGGLFNGATLLQGNNLFCFAYQAARQAQADLVTSLLTILAGDAAKQILSLGCNQLAKIDESVLTRFPGYLGPNAQQATPSQSNGGLLGGLLGGRK